MTDISQKWLDGLYVLGPFTRNYSLQLHASEIARLLHLPQKTCARYLDNAAKINLLQFVRVGRNKYFSLDLSHSATFSLLVMMESYKELSFYRRYPIVASILQELSKEHSVILFGSYAKGLAKHDSDVDLVIIGKKSAKFNSLAAKYPLEVNIHYVTAALLEKRLKEGQALAKEIMKDHILFGEKEKIIKMFKDYSKQ